MATHVQNARDPGAPLSIPKRGPAWTFYMFTLLAVLVAVATYVGFRIAGAL